MLDEEEVAEEVGLGEWAGSHSDFDPTLVPLFPFSSPRRLIDLTLNPNSRSLSPTLFIRSCWTALFPCFFHYHPSLASLQCVCNLISSRLLHVHFHDIDM